MSKSDRHTAIPFPRADVTRYGTVFPVGLNGQKLFRLVMTHRVDDRDYVLYELTSGRLVWIFF